MCGAHVRCACAVRMCGAHVLCVISACKIKKMEKTSVGEHFTSSISGPTLPGCRIDDGVLSLAAQVSPFDPMILTDPLA